MEDQANDATLSIKTGPARADVYRNAGILSDIDNVISIRNTQECCKQHYVLVDMLILVIFFDVSSRHQQPSVDIENYRGRFWKLAVPLIRWLLRPQRSRRHPTVFICWVARCTYVLPYHTNDPVSTAFCQHRGQRYAWSRLSLTSTGIFPADLSHHTYSPIP